MGNCKWSRRALATRLLFARRARSPSTLSWFQCVTRSIRRRGMSFAAYGLRFSAGRRACERTKQVTWDAKLRLIFARGVFLSSSFEVRVRTLGSPPHPERRDRKRDSGTTLTIGVGSRKGDPECPLGLVSSVTIPDCSLWLDPECPLGPVVRSSGRCFVVFSCCCVLFVVFCSATL